MLRAIPLSPFGWLALGAAVASAGLAVAALRLPAVQDAACPSDEAYTLPSGREARLCGVTTETQPFTSEDWLIVRMVVPDLPAPGAAAGHSDHDWACARFGLAALGAAARPP
ncbi:DUF6497 family protein, partial [Roseibacterium sp. SDUM158017]|uniref:DUF6497 family protein n=1 Tax=Roseicyclus salinarum TaxID=3036773 RepID=UPI0024151C56